MHSFKRLFLVVLIFTASAAFPAQTETDLKSAQAIKIGIQPNFGIKDKTSELSTLQERMAVLNIPAVSIAFMERHKISWTLTEGVIDFESQQKIDDDTLFQTAIISKPVFAAVLLKYRQEHGLKEDADINTLLKSWQLPTHKWSASSPARRHLLSHSSSPAVHDLIGYAAGGVVPAIIEMLKGEDLVNSNSIFVDKKPSASSRYSGDGTTLAHSVLHDQFSIWLSELAILNPSSTKHNTYSHAFSKQLAKNAATPHRAIGVVVEDGLHPYTTSATAGFWATPSDLLTLASEFQIRNQGLGKLRFTNKTATQILRPQMESMGIGFLLEKQDSIVTSFSHGGSNDGFRAKVYIHAETGDGIAIMTNSDNGGELINDLLSRVSKVYGWGEFSQIEQNMAVLEPELPELIMDEIESVNENTVRKPRQSPVVLVAEGEQL